MMTLDKVFNVLNGEGQVLKASKNIETKEIPLKHLSYNSKDINENTLFICKGKRFKEEYLTNTIDAGTVAYISENYYENIPEDIDYLIVKDIREAMHLVSNLFYDYAWKDITTVGLTGTKGKTTTTYYLNNIISEHLGKRCAIISTIDTYSGITDEESHLTTPESPDLHRLFYETKQSDIPVLVMEVASQGYKAKRTNGVTFDIGVFLNISEDHISEEEHPNFEDYLDCKLQFIENTKTVIINRDTDYYDLVLDRAKNADKIITYGTDERADYYISNVYKDGEYNAFEVVNNGETKTFKTNMHGRFNTENALAAIVVSKELGIEDRTISHGIENTQVKGRMNVFEKDGVTVIVDYAHNKLSFSKLYESLALDYPDARIISIGGAPGEKAYTRRKDFAEVVGENSDYIYLTEEEPQFEETKDICMEIASHMTNNNYEIIEDRAEAINTALGNAKEGDVIVCLAKGEETYQKVKGQFIPYESDLKLVEGWANRKTMIREHK